MDVQVGDLRNPIRVRERHQGGVMVSQGPATLWLSREETDELSRVLGDLAAAVTT